MWVGPWTRACESGVSDGTSTLLHRSRVTGARPPEHARSAPVHSAGTPTGAQDTRDVKYTDRGQVKDVKDTDREDK